ncbi:co-chaperone YbbN [Paeniglutamicibacter cryotolerans]|uniref:Putative thioredoxin n=1 Tax=Paeniglutamicibacter cryotolerans TaxID=670079 RepID=A0A839QKL8_9MICC|nr:tetratricopeptide repeat protein [Paeniglutamicibacter cryotolerans]MBB2996397.1 putative thioredoxin [Paeniglutamicibacter cryotolerans]
MTSLPEPTAPSSRGAIDLTSLQHHAPEPVDDYPTGPAWVRTANTQNFPEIVALSQQVPVVVSLGGPRSDVSLQLDGLLARAVNARGGKFVLATVDAEAEAAIAQAFRVTQVPAVVALINGQPVPMFQGMVEPEHIDSLLDELQGLALQNGVVGEAQPIPAPGTPADLPAPLPPLHQAALDALAAGDLDGAEAAYRKALAEKPNDDDAAVGLARVQLQQRTAGADLNVARAAAAADPDDLQAQLAVADLDMLGGHVEDAFARLVSFIGRSAGEEKEAARGRLIELYSVTGTTDERVVASRQKLARVLF